jgi:hypothetical protein
MTINSATGLITWTPDYSDLGEHAVSVTVDDGRGGSAVQDYTITVEHLNEPPQITSSPILTATAHARCGALYLLDEASGSTAYDSSGNNYDGSILGATYSMDTSFDYPGNAALSFDGVDDYVDLPQLSYPVGSVEMWIKHDWTPDGATQASWANGDSDANPSFNIVFGTISGSITGEVLTVLSDNEIGVAMWTAYGSSDLGNPSPDEWHHIVIIRAETYGKLYFDGKEVTASIGSSISGGPFATSTSNSYPLFADGACHYLGKRVNGLSYFNGLIDEVAIYDRALTASEIAYDVAYPLDESIYTYSVDATDPDGDALTYSLIVSPEGMTIDAATGVIQWTPSEVQVGTHDVAVEVSDGRGGTASQSFTIEVQAINNPPNITSTPVTTGTEGMLYTYDVDAEDADGDTLTYSLTLFPDGMTIDPDTGLIQWTPSGAQSGSHDVTVEVSDGKGGTDSQSLIIQVGAINIFTDVGASAGVNDTGLGRGVAWGDYDSDGDLDLYLTNDGANRLYQNNGDGAFADVASSSGVGDSGDGYGVAWGDYNNDGALDLYLANEGSANRLYHNNSDGTFTDIAESAGVADAGGGAVTWEDYDNDGALDLYLTIEGSANLLYRNNGDGTFTDIAESMGMDDTESGRGFAWGDYDNDGDLDLYIANVGSTNLLNRNNGDGTFTDVAASAGVDDTGNGKGVAWGDYDNDGDLDLYVSNEGSANLLYRSNGDGTFTDIAESAGMADIGNGQGIAWGDYDSDGDLDIYLVNSGSANRLYRNNQDDANFLLVRPLDAAGRFNRHGTMVHVFQAGTTTLIGVRTIDGGSSYMSQNAYDVHFGLDASGTYDIQVTFSGGIDVVDKNTDPLLGNVSPMDIPQGYVEVRQSVLNAPTIISTPVTTATEGVIYTYDVDATDADGDTLIYVLTTFPAGMTIEENTGIVDWTPSGTQSGDHDVTAEVFDGRGGTDSQSFTIAVEEAVNTPPTITSTPPKTAGEGEVYSYHVQAFDADGDTLLVFLTEFPESIVMDSSTGIITWIPSGTDAGTHYITIVVSDGRGGTDEQSFIVQVEEGINNPPVIISAPPTTAVQGAQYNYDVQATDPDGDTLTFGLTAGPIGMVIDANTGLIALMPFQIHIGVQNVTVQVNDGRGGTATQDFAISVAANNTPVIISTPVVEATEGVLYTYQAQATDADDDAIIYSLTIFPEGMTINATTGEIQWTPIGAQIGSQAVVVRVSDEHGAASVQSFDITVEQGPNFEPIITSTAVTEANDGILYTYDVHADDPNGDVLTYTLTAFPEGMTIGSATGMIQWTPTIAQIGSHPVVVEVSDGRGGIATQSFTITVIEVNHDPEITSSPVTTATEGIPYIYEVQATDPDGDALTFTLTTSPEGMTINGATGMINWTPDNTQSGSRPVVVEVTDGLGGRATQSFTIEVTEAINAEPQITSAPLITAVVGLTYTYDVHATDPDGDALTFSLTTFPEGMTINANTGVITWTPTLGQLGDHNVALDVNDGSGGTDNQSYTITVVESVAQQIIVTIKGPSSDGIFAYSYNFVNDSSTIPLFRVFFRLDTVIADVIPPRGWQFITDYKSFVKFFSTGPAHDIPAGGSLDDFVIVSLASSGVIECEILDTDLNRYSTVTTGPGQ